MRNSYTVFLLLDLIQIDSGMFQNMFKSYVLPKRHLAVLRLSKHIHVHHFGHDHFSKKKVFVITLSCDKDPALHLDQTCSVLQI